MIKSDDSIAVAEHSKIFLKVIVSQETSEVTSNIKHPRKYYVNYISTNLLTQMINTRNDSQGSGG